MQCEGVYMLCNWSSLDSHVHMNARQKCAHQLMKITQCSLNAADVADCGMKLSKGNAWMISCSFVVVRVLMEECGFLQHSMGQQLLRLI